MFLPPALIFTDVGEAFGALTFGASVGWSSNEEVLVSEESSLETAGVFLSLALEVSSG